MMRTAIFFGGFCLAILSTTSAQETQLDVEQRVDAGLINDVNESTVALHPATPFLESSSLLLVDINLEKINVAATTNYLDQILGTSKFDKAGQPTAAFLDSLRAAGVSHLYLSAATRSPIDGGPILIVPCEAPDLVTRQAKALTEAASPFATQKIHAGEEVIVVGAEKAVQRVSTRPGVNRPDLILPLESDDLLDHSAVISLPEEVREELLAFWPDRYQIPSLQLELSPRQIIQDVSRIVISLRLPPDLKMSVRIETIDENAATRIRELIEQLLARTGDIQSSIDLKIVDSNVNLSAKPEAFLKLASTLSAPARKQAMQRRKINSMKQLGLGLHGYHAKEKQFPPRAIQNQEGKPLLSWRVAILPHIDQMAMYQAIKTDQAWDSQANQLPNATRIPTYNDDPELGNKTTIRAPVYPGSLWDGDKPKAIREITDGTSLTIALVDAPPAAAVQWANPEPWVLSEKDPMADVFGDRPTATVLMLDGSVRVLSRKEMTNEKLKAMLTIAGREPVN